MYSQMLGDNMKRIIILLTICLLLVGCKAEYKIEIKDDTIYDTIKIYEESDRVNNASKDNAEEVEQELIDWERGYEDYSKELYTEDIYTGYKYKNTYTFDEYSILSQLSKCYNSLRVDNSNIIRIKSSKEFLCADYYDNVDELNIIIKTEYQIISSNADIKEEGKHIWHIRKNNYQNKPINIEIKKEKENNNTTRTKKK